MICRRQPPAGGCVIYFLLSILTNSLVLIIRISAHDIPANNTTTITTMQPMTIAPTATATGTTTTTAAATMAASTLNIRAETNNISNDDSIADNIFNNSDMDPLQFKTNYHFNTNENLTALENAPIVSSLASDENNADNELHGDADNVILADVYPTVVPIAPLLMHGTFAMNAPKSTIMSSTNMNVTRQTAAAGDVAAPTPSLQIKNASRVQARRPTNSRTAIKLSASSAAANQTQSNHRPDAPMLNYIFDAHLASKHRHYDRYGPHFEEVHVAEKVGNVSAQLSSVAHLNCRIRLLQDKTVTWLKREQNNDHIQLLTVGTHTYTYDPRFTVEFESPNNWRLRIADVNKTDEGLYECQISTHPPRAIRTQFYVKSPEVFIVDELEQPLADKHYQVDSTIELVCIVRHVSMISSAVYWLHGNRTLNFDMTRGGISVKTDLMENGANSTLFIAKVRKTDAGNYTCSIGPNDFYAINVHILSGESLAELYHGSGVSSLHHSKSPNWICFLLTAIVLFVSTQFHAIDTFTFKATDR